MPISDKRLERMRVLLGLGLQLSNFDFSGEFTAAFGTGVSGVSSRSLFFSRASLEYVRVGLCKRYAALILLQLPAGRGDVFSSLGFTALSLMPAASCSLSAAQLGDISSSHFLQLTLSCRCWPGQRLVGSWDNLLSDVAGCMS